MNSQTLNVLICSGSGYIGSSFAQYLLRQQKYNVIVVDNLSNGWHINKDVTAFYKADIGDYNRMREIININNIDIVFHFCAYLDVSESVRDPLKYYDNNIGNSVKLLKACMDERCFKFVFSSSAAVYGEPKFIPIDENHSLKPINPYGRTKKYFEKILEELHSSNKEFNYVSLRYFNVAGTLSEYINGEAHEPETHLIPNILDAAIGKCESVNIFGTDYNTKDGTCIRDYIHIEDLCDAHEKAMNYLTNKNQSNVFNLGSGCGYSIKEVINCVKKVTNKEFKVIEGARRDGDPAILIASNTKAKNELDWQPSKSLEDIITSAFHWHLKKDNTISKYKIFKEIDMFEEFGNKFEISCPKDLKLVFAPGRINFIGEHTDYNGGFVLPCAIDKGTYMIGKLANSNNIRIYSSVFNDYVSFDIGRDFKSQMRNDWSDHICSSLYLINTIHKIDKGFNIYCYSNMPLGGGMSSSTSVVIAILLLCFKLLDMNLPENEADYLFKLAFRVEYEILGIKCGIMDQFTIINGKKNKLTLLNCMNKESKLIPAEFGKYKLLVANTNYKRQLKDSKYNERVEECQKALSLLQAYKPTKTISDYNINDLNQIEKVLNNDLLYRRVKHVITENKRVMDCIEYLSKHDFKLIGNLLNESHTSLKNDYEVTGLHLDCIVKAMQSCKGVLGCRMMGAGFGGCVIALVEDLEIENIKKKSQQQYFKDVNIESSFYQFNIEDGARVIDL